ncbi:MAG: hypothetical protein IJ257_06755 [Treponema sp.]|nr:hypothetical protein [Treponema sp.]
MKRTTLFLCLVTFIAGAAFCADIPSWVKNPEKDFPDSAYIKALGEGSSVKKAQDSALSDISLFFDTKIDYLKVAVDSAREIMVDDKSVFTSDESYKKITQITSSSEFFCVKFTESYYDKKSDKFSALAYINKKEASQIYASRISALMESVNAYRAFAQKEKEPFIAVQALQKAKVLSKLAESYIHNETIIIPSDSEKYQNDLKTIALIPSEIAAIKKGVTFSIKMNQKERKFDPIFSTVASILEKYGYAYSVSNSAYKILIDISCIEESYDAGEFVRPSVDVLIMNNAGSGVYTYSKAFQRIGSKSMEQAYTRTVTKIKQDLEENFLAE